ncbi:hypothetical protein IWQ57_001816 [Coemansia nantahalensis]|uniref:Uncharacterized protein n=2 Tax=Coemansia TaxID=4863 RepID=A0ACC1LBU4_9FUNG|nr:hypothetical protein IWQ57_001816 [Coemansia nantahalensis]KAJ2804422.1 hypothetical protein H4R21_001650 [Coemansia helicoidea]
MDAAIPDFILASALRAQQARSRRSSRRSSLRPSGLLATPLSSPFSSPASSPVASPRTPTAAPAPAYDATQDSEIKEVIGYLHGAPRSWPQHMQADVPRLVHF